MTVTPIEKASDSTATDRARMAIPYRIVALEKMLKGQPLPTGTAISVERVPLSTEEEKRLFPKFTLDRYYVHVQNRERAFSISGVSEWGIFWYRVDAGKPQHPDRDAIFFGTIDRLSSVAEFVVSHL
jgi:hypothetical protein